jgi:predicted PurR-regulated permease PerM
LNKPEPAPRTLSRWPISGAEEPQLPTTDDVDAQQQIGRLALIEIAEPADAPVEGPVSPDIKTFFLGGLFTLALLAAFYAAAEIALPIVIAFILMLVLQPAMRLLERLHVPRMVAALLMLAVLFVAVAGLVAILSGPAAGWAQKLPESIPKLQDRLSFLSKPIAALQKFISHAETLANGVGRAPMPVAVEGTGLSQRLLEGTRSIVGGMLETALVLFFLLLSGDIFLRRLVEVLPSFKNKRQAVEISQQIESDIAAYLTTITVMNVCVGLATAAIAALCGMGDPVLWGTVAFLLNYVPILGPTVGVVLFLLIGLISIDPLWEAFLPAGLYLGVHLIEGETVTPMLLARRFTINPVLVIVSLVFWYWMWGIPGAIISTPMLAIAKIICDRIQSLAAFGHFIEG